MKIYLAAAHPPVLKKMRRVLLNYSMLTRPQTGYIKKSFIIITENHNLNDYNRIT